MLLFVATTKTTQIKKSATMNLKKPNECTSLDEVRIEIDKIDHQIIQLFSERMKYVEAVVSYKNDEEGIIAEDRKNHVIHERSKWAKEAGLDPSTIEQMYTLLIEHNIRHEMELLKTQKNENQ